MDPADLQSVRGAVTNQGALLDQHSLALQEIMKGLQELSTSVAGIQHRLSAPVGPPAPAPDPAQTPPVPVPPYHREPQVPTPERYDGDLGSCRAFLLQCGLVFDQQPTSFATDGSKIAFVIGLLRGKALEWASAVWETQSNVASTYPMFTSEMRKLFDHPVRGRDASKRLHALRQGTRGVADYAIEFRTLAVESGWNDEALESVFYNGLSSQIKDELVSYPEPETLEDLVQLAIRVDNRCRERQRERRRSESPLPRRVATSYSVGGGPPRYNARSPAGTNNEERPEHEPMQLGRYHLDEEERRRRFDNNSCLFCGLQGHYRSSCPRRSSNRRAR